ncbi:MAG: 6-bladed beta-propeller, partial [Candidatus Aminicenantes bacterium]|nr:6-bladed beta-propeller [Candidatus Aminicenantes bacterium]
MNRLFFWPFIIAVGLVSCKSNHDVVRVSSLRPKYPDRQIELIKRYVIDVTQINMFSKETSRGFDNAIAFDGNANMYILDTYESTISVFDNNGRLVRSFGGPGQGPGEFSRPSMMFIKGDEIYVLQGWGLDFK